VNRTSRFHSGAQRVG